MFLGPYFPTDVVCFSRRHSNPTGQTFTLFNKRAFPPATHLRPSALSSIFCRDRPPFCCAAFHFFYLAFKENGGKWSTYKCLAFRNQSNGGEKALIKQPNSLLTISTCASGPKRLGRSTFQRITSKTRVDLRQLLKSSQIVVIHLRLTADGDEWTSSGALMQTSVSISGISGFAVCRNQPA